MKMFLSIAAMIIAVSSCNKNDLNVPPEYEMLIGKWESYRFVFDNQYPGSHGNNYFVTEEFTGDSLPYKLILNLYADSWEVLSDKTFLYGDKIEGFEVNVFGSYYVIYLLKNKKRKFSIYYRNGEISFMASIYDDYLPDYATIYLKRVN